MAKGIRRITGITGEAALEARKLEESMNERMISILKALDSKPTTELSTIEAELTEFRCDNFLLWKVDSLINSGFCWIVAFYLNLSK